MGGHGGLNILPQKRWNVYNYENREKVRRDEEAAAKDEQIKREQSRKRDAEFRLDRLRASRGLAPLEREPESSNHINLFEGIKVFAKEERRAERSERKKEKEEVKVRVVTAEEERYRLGYGVAGKGVRVPWYLERKGSGCKEEERGEREEEEEEGKGEEEKKKKRKKSLEELRAERMKREKKEKEREREVLFGRLEPSVRSSGRFSGRR